MPTILTFAPTAVRTCLTIFGTFLVIVANPASTHATSWVAGTLAQPSTSLAPMSSVTKATLCVLMNFTASASWVPA
jgi:hypothetical protein